MERIGIVQSLFYYEKGKIWETFFRQAGYEIVLSEPAKDSGMQLSEACQPIQNCILHVQNLINRRVDWIFLPRVVSNKKGYCSCPKIQGICDVVRAMLPKSVQLLEPVIREKDGKYASVYQIGRVLGIPAGAVRYLYKEALRLNLPRVIVPKSPYIVVLGHSYVLQDPDIGKRILDYLQSGQYEIITDAGMPDELLLQKGRALQQRQMFWYTGQKQIGLCQMMLERPDPPAGVLYVSVFGCGIDDFIWPYCEKLVKGKSPFMHMKLDQQYHEAGIQTRLEAFGDMLERSQAS